MRANNTQSIIHIWSFSEQETRLKDRSIKKIKKNN